MRADAFGRVRDGVLRCRLRAAGVLRAHRPYLVVVLAGVPVLGVASMAGAQGRDDRALAKQQSVSRAKGQRAERRSAARGLGREIVSLRTRSSRTFVDRRGGRTVRIAADSLHVRGRQGRWASIDSRLVRRGGRLLNRANRYSTSLPLDLGSGRVRVRRGARWIDFRLRGARGGAVVRGNAVRYRDALPGVDVVYRALADAVKEELVLASASSPRRFVFDVGMSRGLSPRLLASNAVVLVDRRGRRRLSVAAPFMADRKGRRSSRIALDLDKVEGRWRLTVTPDRRWLLKRARAWPVTVDPYVYTQPDRDCRMVDATPESSLCGDAFLSVGRTAAGAEHQSAVKFDLSAIPGNAEVVYASLELYKQSQENETWTQLQALPASEAWTGAASWNRADGTDRWGEPGGEVDDAAPADYSDWIGGSQSTGLTWFYVHNIVSEWVKGERPNHGFIVRRRPGSAENYATFGATEASSGDPYLYVRYMPRIGQRRGYKLETQRLSDRIRLSVNAANGNLLVEHSDFSMPGGLGPDVSIGRAYNSLRGEAGALGDGWNLSTGHDVKFPVTGFAGGVYKGPSGTWMLYEDTNPATSQPEGFVTPAGADNVASKNADATYTITENASQAKQHFDADGRLTAIEDRNGRKVTVAYTPGEYKVATVADAQGDTVTFDYTGGGPTKLTKFTDPAGRQHAFGYDANNRLASASDPQNGSANPTRYEYNGPGAMLSKITTPGGRVTTIGYYPDGHDDARKVKTVTRVTDTAAMTGPTWTYEYTLRLDGSGQTRVTDPVGTHSTDANDRVTRYEIDDQSRVTAVRDALGRKTSRKLTSNSNVQSYTKASNTGTTPSTSFTYDSDTDMLTGTETPTGNGKSLTTTIGYDKASTIAGGKYLPVSATNEQNRTTQFGYDADGNLKSQKSELAVQNTVTYNYSATVKGRLESIVDGNGHTTSYGYDAKGNVNKVTPPAVSKVAGAAPGATTMTHHPSLDRIETVKDGKGQTRSLSYDHLDRVTKITYSDGRLVAFGYDADGNVTSQTESDSTKNFAYTYDALGRLTSEDSGISQPNTYDYDRVGNLRSLTDPGGKVEYAYNAVNELRALYQPGTARPTKFDYDQDGRRTKTAYPNGVSMTVGYDEADRVRSIESIKAGASSPLQKFRYDYDVSSSSGGRETGLRTLAIDDVAQRKTAYVYDELDRLKRARTLAVSDAAVSDTTTCATTAGLACFEYTLDGNSNRTKETVTGSSVANSTTDYTYNEFNQLLTRTKNGTARNFAYDANGNQTADGACTFGYNNGDQTTSLCGWSQGFFGAGQGERHSYSDKTLHNTVLGVTERKTSTGTVNYARDEQGGLVSQRGALNGFFLFDALGSVTGLTDAGGSLVRAYTYDPYGRTMTATGGADVYVAFAGGYVDRDGSTDPDASRALHHFGQRFYDPKTGRWTQPDPIDQTGDLREGNRYAYVGADPINLTDPTGTHIDPDCPLAPGEGDTLDRSICRTRGQRAQYGSPLERFGTVICKVLLDLSTRGASRSARPSVPESPFYSPCDGTSSDESTSRYPG
jgi:RHS repeat-associated protein